MRADGLKSEKLRKMAETTEDESRQTEVVEGLEDGGDGGGCECNGIAEGGSD
jgi:hypothetical protein